MDFWSSEKMRLVLLVNTYTIFSHECSRRILNGTTFAPSKFLQTIITNKQCGSQWHILSNSISQANAYKITRSYNGESKEWLRLWCLKPSRLRGLRDKAFWEGMRPSKVLLSILKHKSFLVHSSNLSGLAAFDFQERKKNGLAALAFVRHA